MVKGVGRQRLNDLELWLELPLHPLAKVVMELG
jgi:hypothetical protein